MLPSYILSEWKPSGYPEVNILLQFYKLTYLMFIHIISYYSLAVKWYEFTCHLNWGAKAIVHPTLKNDKTAFMVWFWPF